MSDPSPPRAVIDADIIFSRVLHELIGRIARTMRLLDLIWSDELLEEAKNKLIERKGLADPVAERWVGYLRENFPSGQTGTENVLTNEQLGAPSILTTGMCARWRSQAERSFSSRTIAATCVRPSRSTASK